MKHTLLTLIGALLLGTTSFAQVNTIVQAPPTSNGTTQVRAPNGLASHTSLRAHFVITAAELAALPSGSNLSIFGFTLADGVTSGATGTLKVYLEATSDLTNLKSATWSTAISTMTEVYNGSYTLPVTAVAANVDLTLPTPFAYTGTGLYVAYEYVATTTDIDPATYNANTDIASAVKMVSNTTTTPGTTLSTVSSFRPCVRLGFPNPNTNDISLEAILDRNGKINSALQSTQDVKVLVKNASNTTVSSVNVSLNMGGANTFVGSQVIASMAPGATQELTFSGIPTVSNGNQLGIVTIPNDDDNSNNFLAFVQTISCDTLGYYNTDTANNAIGFGNGTSCLANKHVIPGTIPTRAMAVGVVLSDEVALVGNQIKGVLFDATGQPIDSSASVTITNAMLGNRVQMDFLNADSNIAGQTVFIGFRQSANAVTPYFPLAVQADENATADRYYSLGVYGGNLASYNTFGVFMIDAIMAPKLSLTSSIGNVVCPSTNLLYSATSGYANYDFYVDGAVVNSGASSTFPYTPIDTHQVLVSVSSNSCVFSDSLSVMVQNIDTTKFSAQICDGESYSFGGIMLSQAGIYDDLLTSAFGCDSAVQLSLMVNSLDTTLMSASICTGETYEFYGQQLSASGVYTEVLSAATGCDSTIELSLAVNPPYSESVSAEICDYAFYDFGGNQLNVPGVYVDTFQTVAGCDSVVTLNLTTSTVDVEVILVNPVATAAEADAEYQWIRCPSNVSIPGATNRKLTPASSGSFKVAVTKLGCTDTSECVDIVVVGVGEIGSRGSVAVYPNPADDQLNVTSEVKFSAVAITDLTGKTVGVWTQNLATERATLDVGNLPAGVYMLNITGEDHAILGKSMIVIK